jgi:glycosyltransferase involved in cell wall biosynthesis
MGVPQHRIKVIFNGVDPEKFRPSAKEPYQKPVVSVLGLVYRLKGQLEMIEATSQLKSNLESVEVRFYGDATDPKYLQACQQRVRSLRLDNNIVFAGPTKQPWKVYSDADVMVFPSISEGFPYVVLEAMFCGAAIVATDVGGVREALGDCGLIVPPRNPAALAEAVSFLLGNPEQRETFGRKAYQRAVERFTEAQFLRRYETTYADLLSLQPRQSLNA